MLFRTEKKIQLSEYGTLIFLIVPITIFGLNFSLDFFIPRLFNTFYPDHATYILLLLLLNASFIGSFLTALWTFVYYRKKQEKDNPEHYKQLILYSLIISAAGMLSLSVSWFNGSIGLLIAGRFLVGIGFTLLNIVIFPVILGTHDEKLQAFWFLFITGFSAFGRFLVYPSSYLFFNPGNESASQPYSLSIYYFVMLIITLLIIFFSIKIPLKLGGIFFIPSGQNPGAPHFSYEVITGIAGLAIMGFYEFFLSLKTDFSWSRSSDDPNLYKLVHGLAMMSGSFMLGRFGASIKLSALPSPIKNFMLVLLTASIVFFISLVATMMNISLNDIMTNLLISVIFIIVLLISRNNIFSIFTGASLGGFIHTHLSRLFSLETLNLKMQPFQGVGCSEPCSGRLWFILRFIITNIPYYPCPGLQRWL
jgi:MFS family permease